MNKLKFHQQFLTPVILDYSLDESNWFISQVNIYHWTIYQKKTLNILFRYNFIFQTYVGIGFTNDCHRLTDADLTICYRDRPSVSVDHYLLENIDAPPDLHQGVSNVGLDLNYFYNYYLVDTKPLTTCFINHMRHLIKLWIKDLEPADYKTICNLGRFKHILENGSHDEI